MALVSSLWGEAVEIWIAQSQSGEEHLGGTNTGDTQVSVTLRAGRQVITLHSACPRTHTTPPFLMSGHKRSHTRFSPRGSQVGTLPLTARQGHTSLLNPEQRARLTHPVPTNERGQWLALEPVGVLT